MTHEDLFCPAHLPLILVCTSLNRDGISDKRQEGRAFGDRDTHDADPLTIGFYGHHYSEIRAQTHIM